METTESLKRKIQTASDLHSLVRTMKALAAVNIRQLEQAVESLADYNRTVNLGLKVLLKKNARLVLSAQSAKMDRVGIVVFGSDQGMCGQFNDHVVRFAEEQMVQFDTDLANVKTLAVGGRIAMLMENQNRNIEATVHVPSSTSGISPAVSDILMRIQRWHSESNVTHVQLFYNQHLSRAEYQPRSKRLLPIDKVWLQHLAEQPWPTSVLPTYSMDSQRLLSALIRQYLFASLYQAFAESLASENASRLASMRAAEHTIADRLTELTARFQQQRQMAITEELLDIAAGFEAIREESSAI